MQVASIGKCFMIAGGRATFLRPRGSCSTRCARSPLAMRWCRRRRRLSPVAAAQLHAEHPSQIVRLTRLVHRAAAGGSRNTALVHSAVRERRSGTECFIQVRVDQAQLDATREGSALTPTNCTFCRGPLRPDADRESMRALTSLISARGELLLPQEWTRLGRTRGRVQRLWRKKRKKKRKIE